MAKILRPTNLSTRVLLVVLALFVASIWALVARVADVLHTDIEKVVSAHLSATADYVADDIDAKIALRIGLLKEIATSITPATLADPLAVRRLLEQRNLSDRLFPTGIFVVDRAGTMIADHPTLARRVGSSIAQFDYFRSVLAGNQIIGSPLMGRFSKQAAVPLAVPLRDAAGTAVGALVGPIYPSDDNLFGRLEAAKIGNSSYFVVISPKDNVIVSATDKSRILQPLPVPGMNVLLDRRRQGYEGMARETAQGGVEVLSVGRNMKTTGWMIIAAIPTDEAYAPIASIKQQIYLTALTLSLLVMAILYFVLRRQLAPLRAATTRIRRMTEGGAAFAPLPDGGEDEIGQLVESFNQLVAERTRLEGVLQLREQHARALFDAMPIAVGHADTAERITFANRVYRTLYTGGSDPAGRTIRDVVGEEIYAITGPLIKRALAGEELQFDRSFTGDDDLPHARWLRYVPDRDAAGEIVGFFALIQDISERKQAEATLAATSELLRDTFDNMVEGISVFDRNLRLASWNRRFGELLSFPDSLLHEGVAFAEFIRYNARRGEYGPGDPEEQVRSRAELAANFQPHRTERTRPDGTVLEIRGSPLPDGGFVTTYTDITQRKRAEEGLRASQQMMEGIINAISVRVFWKDRNLVYLGCNMAFARDSGFADPKDIIGKDDYQMGWRAQADLYRNDDREVIDSGCPKLLIEEPQTTPQGDTITLLTSKIPLRNSKGEISGVLGTYLDITERKRTETQQRLAASVFDHAAEAIMITDSNNDIISVNGAFSEITGYPQEEAIGKNPRLLSSGMQDPGFYEAMWDSIGKNGRWNGEIWDRRKNGEPYCEQISISAVRDQNGEIANYCSIFADITPRKNAETALQRLNSELEQRVAQRTQALEQANHEMQSFSYSISHDLRAPLRAINGFSKIVLAAHAGKLDAETTDNLGRIAAGAERMGRLIDDLLSLAQISRRELHRETVNLSELAAEVANRLAQAEPERRVEVRITPAIMVDADRGLVQALLENLIGNAWKFTRHTDGAKIEIGYSEASGEMIFFVRDNGAGFDMRYAGKLFGAFQRLHSPREFEGTGIGLSIVQRIVIRHGGRIWADATPGQGAAFHFTLAPETQAL